jgi:hypothetical protein
MIGYTGNKMLMPGNFKEYIIYKQRMLNIISTKKELFVVTLKGGIPKNDVMSSLTILQSSETLRSEIPSQRKDRRNSLSL